MFLNFFKNNNIIKAIIYANIKYVNLYIGMFIAASIVMFNKFKYGFCISIPIKPNVKLKTIRDTKHFNQLNLKINFVKIIIQL